jgi:predicted MFS family arabinose efflux permease
MTQIVQTGSAPARRWIIPFAVSLFAMLALQMASIGFSPLLPSIQEDFGINYTQVGLFTGMYGILAIVWSIPAGLAAKKFGEKRVLIAGLLGTAAGMFLLSRAGDFNLGLASRGAWLSAYRFGFVSVLTAITLTRPQSIKGSSMGILGATSSFACCIGAPLATYVGQDFGWRGAFVAFSGIAVVAALVVWAFYWRPSQVAADAPAHGGSVTRGSKSAFRSPLVWALALLVGLSGIPAYSVTFYMPLSAEQVFNLDRFATAAIISMGYAVAIPVNLLFGYLMDRYNKWNVLTVLLIALIPCCLLMVSDNLLVFRLASTAVLALGFALINQIYGLAGEALRGRETGNVMGLVSLGVGVCGYLGPQMMGLLRDWTGGFSASYFMITVVAATALVEIILLKRNAAARREAAVA